MLMSGYMQLSDYIHSIQSVCDCRFTTFSWHV